MHLINTMLGMENLLNAEYSKKYDFNSSMILLEDSRYNFLSKLYFSVQINISFPNTLPEYFNSLMLVF